MEAGIQITDIAMIENVRETKFEYVEVTLDLLESFLEAGISIGKDIKVLSIIEKFTDSTMERWNRIVELSGRLNIPYIVIETRNVKNADVLPMWIKASADKVKKLNVRICIENGYYIENGCYTRNNITDSHEMVYCVNTWNKQMGVDCFGVALNIGYANLFGYNIPAMIEELMNYIVFIHANDNDGIHDMHQLPHTFTVGRGTLSTSWYKIIWSLTKIKYNGVIVFDANGMLFNVPSPLLSDIMNLTYALFDEWNKQVNIEKRLGQEGKQLILFGAGKIFENYMMVWGDEYPPLFCVDNNPETWGKIKCGVEIKSPQAIMDIPPDQRNVWICNLYYRQITEQLQTMGVYAQWFDDQYII